MNSKLRSFVFFLILLNFVVVTYELVQLVFTSTPIVFSSYDFTEIKKKHAKGVFINLMRVLISFIVVYVVDFKVYENQNQVIDTESLSLKDSVNGKKKFLFARFFESNKALIAIYLAFLVITSFQYEILTSIIAPTILYYGIYAMYAYLPYFKWIFWDFFFGLICKNINKFVKAITSTKPSLYHKITTLDINILPSPILDYLKKNNYEFTLKHLDVPDAFTVAVLPKGNKNISIVIFGNILKIATKDEFLSILYHEVGHLDYEHSLKKIIFFYFLGFIAIFFEILLVKFNKKLIKPTENEDEKESKKNRVKNMICLYVLFLISIDSYLMMANNIFTYYQELSADNYSVKSFNTKSLESFLIKQDFYGKNYPDFSLFYNYFYFTHPSLVKRLSNIKK